MITDLHHIQFAMPEGEETVARRFHGGVLDLPEVEKPDALKARGGVWFEAGRVRGRVHLGSQRPFHPAGKVHPAFRVAAPG